jgi:hypothetical protein
MIDWPILSATCNRFPIVCLKRAAQDGRDNRFADISADACNN